MDNIKDILKANGVELDDEKLKAIEKATLENYRTKAELDGKTQKVTDLEAQLAKANEALEAAQKADPAKTEEFEAMQKQLAEYKKADTAAFEKAKANPDMEAKAILDSVTVDEDGIWANPQRDPKKMPGANDGGGSNNTPIQSFDDLKNMSVEEVRKNMSEVNKLLEDQK